MPSVDILHGWDGAEAAISISQQVLPHETHGRYFLETRKPFVRLITAWQAGEAVGYLIVEFDHEDEYLREVGVLPAHQGKGVGRALVHAYASTATVPTLWVRPLETTRAIFLGWGFRESEDRDLRGDRDEVARLTAPRP